VEGSIFHGPFGKGLFQGIYANLSRCWLDWMSGVLWILLCIIALLLRQPAVALVIIALSLALAACRMRRLPAFPFVLQWQEKLLLLLLCWWQPVAREWARVVGMIRLHARPSCKPPLREVFVPSRPRKWSFSLGELAFWSDAGIGRDEFLKCLQTTIANQGQSVRADDGWRLLDVEARPQTHVSTAVISATEHHGGQRCLTRVRLLLRIHPQVLSYFLLVVCIISPASMRRSSGILGVELALMVLGVFCCLLFIRRRIKKAALIAASEAGLTPCSATPSVVKSA
jgi:hypothetical protein